MKKPGLSFRTVLSISLLIVITSGLLIYFSYDTFQKNLEESTCERLEAIAVTGAMMIDGDAHDALGKSGDSKGKAFIKIQHILRKIKEKNNLKEELNTYRRQGDELRYIVMSKEKPSMGELPQIKEEMWPVLQNEKISNTRIDRDPQGTRVTAYAPILDSRDRVSGILEVGVRLERVDETLKGQTIRLVIISAIILIFGVFLSIVFTGRIGKKLSYLSQTMEKISLGQTDLPIQITSNDEFGVLSESIERMRISLKMAMDIIEEKED